MLAILINKSIWLLKQNTEAVAFYILNYLCNFIWFFFILEGKRREGLEMQYKKMVKIAEKQ